MTKGVVASLEGKAAIERLPIRDPCLGLHAHPPRTGFATPDLGVPGASIPGNRERHLRSPRERRMELPPKSLQQGELGPIANRVAGWVGSHCEVEPDDRAPRTHRLDGHAIQVAAFETDQLLVRGARSCSDFAEAEPRADPREAMIPADAPHGFAPLAAAPIRGSLSRSHVAYRATRLFTADYLPRIGDWSARRTNGRGTGGYWACRARSSVRWSASGTKRRSRNPKVALPSAPAVPWSASRTNGRARRRYWACRARSSVRWSASGTKRQSRNLKVALPSAPAVPWSARRTTPAVGARR